MLKMHLCIRYRNCWMFLARDNIQQHAIIFLKIPFSVFHISHILKRKLERQPFSPKGRELEIINLTVMCFQTVIPVMKCNTSLRKSKKGWKLIFQHITWSNMCFENEPLAQCNLANFLIDLFWLCLKESLCSLVQHYGLFCQISKKILLI